MNPYKTTVAVKETVEFAVGRYADPQGLLYSPGAALGTASAIAFPVN